MQALSRFSSSQKLTRIDRISVWRICVQPSWRRVRQLEVSRFRKPIRSFMHSARRSIEKFARKGRGAPFSYPSTLRLCSIGRLRCIRERRRSLEALRRCRERVERPFSFSGKRLSHVNKINTWLMYITIRIFTLRMPLRERDQLDLLRSYRRLLKKDEVPCLRNYMISWRDFHLKQIDDFRSDVDVVTARHPRLQVPRLCHIEQIECSRLIQIDYSDNPAMTL